MKKQIVNRMKWFYISLLSLVPLFSSAQGWEKLISGEFSVLSNRVFAEPDSTYYLPMLVDGNYRLFHLDNNGYELSSPELPSIYHNPIIIRTADGNFVTANSSDNTTPATLNDILVYKYDEIGNLIWQYGFGSDQTFQSITTIIEDENGDFVFAGGVGDPDPTVGYVAKFNNEGEQLWMELIPGAGQISNLTVTEALEGGYLVGGGASGGASVIAKYSDDGDVEWANYDYETTFANPIISLADGSFLTIIGTGSEKFILKLNGDGTEQWIQSIGVCGGDLVLTEDGGMALLTTCVPGPVIGGIYLIKMDAGGNQQWVQNYQAYPGSTSYLGLDLDASADGGFIITTSTLGGGAGEGYIVKTDANGNALTSVIKGQAFYDLNDNCVIDSAAVPLEAWVVTAIGEENYYAAVQADGSYAIKVDTGNYNLQLITPNDYWLACDNMIPVQVTDFYDTVAFDFVVQDVVDCPLMEVQTSAMPFRLCDTITMNVHYCNKGTIEAQGVTVEIVFDDGLDVVDAAVPILNQVDNTYTFDVGDVDFLECGSFTISLGITCDIDLFGQTLCTETNIFPDTSCTTIDPLWSGASIDARARCEGSEVKLGLYNIGNGDMQAPLQYIVVEDDVIMMADPFQLDSGDSTIVSLPANGSFYRIESPQVPFHPGNSMPSAHLEACGVNNSGDISTGFVVQYSQNDANFNVDILCREVVAAYDPNQKEASPVGYQTPHYIEENTLIDYTIQFQNTGTDTARKVVLQDLLSPHLNPATFQAGASSHPYEVKMEGQGMLIFTFDNIMLPDSNINEPASHGFVQFKIAQQVDLPVGTVIENTASIFFDYNPPIVTNTVYHTIGKDFILVDIGEITLPDVSINVYPNPFSQRAVFELDGTVGKGLEFSLFSPTGQLLREGSFRDNQYILERNGLQAGIYFYAIRQDGALLNKGKVVVH